jgi:putative ABC transport system ATP-binding protein
MSAVEIRDLVVEYHRGDYPVRPLDGFAMNATAGELVLLLGPSGCGKTTLLSCLSGIQRPTSGTITVGDKAITSLDAGGLTAYRRSQVGIVFQAFNLVPSLTAEENVMVPLKAAGRRHSVARARAQELLREVGLGERMTHRPGSLSGGQMQRVAIARALALEPPLVVADEPTANLDHVQVETVLRILRGLTNRGHTIVVSTHDQRLLPLADSVVEMSSDHATHMAGVVSIELAAGDVLFTEGASGNRLFRLEQGTISLTRAGAPLATIGAGDVFGEMAPLFKLPRSATATATGAATVTSYSLDAFTDAFGGAELRHLVGRFTAR